MRFTRLTSKSLILSALALGLALPGVARADVDAVACDAASHTCLRGPLSFAKDDALPIMGGFDTGWVPQGSAIQVDLIAELYADTSLAMTGSLETNWPKPLTLTTPAIEADGTPGAGKFSIHYGVDVGAQAHIHFTVLGVNFDWTGDIPYLPQFDYQVRASADFTPWAFTPVSIDGSTMEQTLAQVSVKDFINLNIPGLDGGFELNSKTDLTATYQTTKMVILHTDGTPISGGPIVAEDGTVLSELNEPLGAFQEYDVHPEGKVTYDGVIHLIPAFYIDTIGPDFSIPVADIPIPFSITQDPWVFDPVRVHDPLPDIEIQGDPKTGFPTPITITIGGLEVGQSAKAQVHLTNVGEAPLLASFAIDNPDFEINQESWTGDPSGDLSLEVTFTPSAPGAATAKLTIQSNDPDEAVRVVTLQSSATPAPTNDGGAGGGDTGGAGGGSSEVDYPSGGACKCDLAGERTSSDVGASAVAWERSVSSRNAEEIRKTALKVAGECWRGCSVGNSAPCAILSRADDCRESR